MDFLELINNRQSCRSYDEERAVEEEKLRQLCGVKHSVRLVITLGYPKNETIREKKRKTLDELVTIL